METTHTAINTATADVVDFDDRAGICYLDELTAEFLADYLSRTTEPHLLTSMRTATDEALFTGPDTMNLVELSDGIQYTVTGTTASTSLRELYIRAAGRATWDINARTVTVEMFA